jgi:HSP20 family molecular chaperone IbpA
MWSEALARLAQTDRLNREAFRPTQVGWEPPIDVLETQAGLLIVVALPGVRHSDVEILVGRGDLLVRGIRHWPVQARPLAVHRVELPHGRFERRLPLPSGTYQLAGQDHADGCLLLTLRRID